MNKTLITLIASLTLSSLAAADTNSTIQQLGSDDYKVRTQARTDLKLAYGNASDAAAVEKAVIAELNSNLPLDQRLYLLRLLEWFGSESAAVAVAPLLTSSESEERDSARRVLMSISGEKSAVSLANALRAAKTTEAKEAYIDALAYHKDPRAVPMISAFLQDSDQNLVKAAVLALGKIGSTDAIAPLKQAYANASAVRPDIELALLRIGADAQAANMLTKDGANAAIRLEAFTQLIQLDATAADAQLVALLAQSESIGRSQLIHAAATMGTKPMQDRLAKHLTGASTADQTLIVVAFGEAGLSQYESELLSVLATCGDWSLRNVIIHALGNLGGDASFEPIYTSFQKDTKNKVIADALSRLDAPSADSKSLQVVKGGSDVAERIAAMKVLELRNTPGATELLNQIAANPGDAKLREAAFKSLENIGTFDTVAIFIDLIVNEDPATRAAQRSLKRLSQNFRAGDALWQQYYKPALDAAASDQAREGLVLILDGVDSRKTLDYLKGHVQNASSPLNASAKRTLARWSSVLAVDTWLEISKESPELEGEATKAIKRLLTSSQVTLSDNVAKIAAWVKAIQKSPNKAFKLEVLSAYEKPAPNVRWIIKSRTKPILNDPEIKAELQAILDQC